MRHKHDCDDDFDYIDSYSDACSDPDPCAERWARDKARAQRGKKRGATIALIVAGVVAVAALAFFLIANGIVVFDNGTQTSQPDNSGSTGKVVVNTDKIGISTDKIIVKEHKNKHNNDD